MGKTCPQYTNRYTNASSNCPRTPTHNREQESPHPAYICRVLPVGHAQLRTSRSKRSRSRMAEVRGSSPLGSTPFFPANTGKRDAPYIWNGGFVQQPCSNACPVRSDSQILSKESSGIPASRCLVLPHIKVVHVGGVQASPWDLFNQLLIIA
jgi:hypothetical protein